MLPQANSFLTKIIPYKGGDIIPSHFVRRISLASNENSLGPGPTVCNTIHELTSQKISFYPSSLATTLRERIAEVHNLDPSWILCGNGSDELLHLLGRTYASPNDEILFPQYAFSLYAIVAHSVGAKPVIIPRNNFVLTAEGILECLTDRSKILFLDNPGNPIGTYLPKNELLSLLEKASPSLLIVIDAAYAEYLEGGVAPDYTSGLDLIADHPNLVVTRTFSKAYGMAGLRLGWACAHPKILDPINRIRPPFNVSGIAQAAGIAALSDPEWLKLTRRYTHNWRHWFEQEVAQMGIPFLPSCTNFSMIDLQENCEAVYEYLGQNGIIVRAMDVYGLPSYLRVTTGQEKEMEELVKRLKDIC